MSELCFTWESLATKIYSANKYYIILEHLNFAKLKLT